MDSQASVTEICFDSQISGGVLEAIVARKRERGIQGVVSRLVLILSFFFSERLREFLFIPTKS